MRRFFPPRWVKIDKVNGFTCDFSDVRASVTELEHFLCANYHARVGRLYVCPASRELLNSLHALDGSVESLRLSNLWVVAGCVLHAQVMRNRRCGQSQHCCCEFGCPVALILRCHHLVEVTNELGFLDVAQVPPSDVFFVFEYQLIVWSHLPIYLSTNLADGQIINLLAFSVKLGDGYE